MLLLKFVKISVFKNDKRHYYEYEYTHIHL